MIWFFTPYAHDKKLLDAIDRHFNLVANPNDWVVLMDGDTAFLRSDFGHVIKRYAELFPDTGMFTCYASRCHYQSQVPEGTNMDSDSILYHRKIADYHAEMFKGQALELNSRIAGHLMVIRKKTWLRIRSAVYSKAINKYILGIDTKISYALLDAGLTIRLMRELYIFHYLRLAEGFDHDKHLKP